MYSPMMIRVCIAIALLSLSACQGEGQPEPGPIFELQATGVVLGAEGGAKAGEPVPHLSFKYVITLHLQGGGSESHAVSATTDENGAFSIDEEIQGSKNAPIATTEAGLRLSTGDPASPATEISAEVF